MHVAAARSFAARAHGSQRYNDAPYTTHTAEVEAALREFGVDERRGEDDAALLMAAQLHDVLEDTPTSPATITARFGPRVAALVDAVTLEPGDTRDEKFARTYPKIRATPRADELKAADRIVNMRQSLVHPDLRHARRYVREYPAFRAALYLPDRIPAMWAELDRLADELAVRLQGAR